MKEDIFHANGTPRQAREIILISDKEDLNIKLFTKDEEGHFILIKGSTQQEEVTILNIHIKNWHIQFL
jgi:hypothetical protein